MTTDAPQGPVAINVNACDGCGICIDSCPTDVFQLDAATGKCQVVYPQDCHVCFLCQDDCPTKAITVSYDLSTTLFHSIYDIVGIKVERYSGEENQ